MTPAELAKLEALCDAAVSGPWVNEDYPPGVVCNINNEECYVVEDGDTPEREFIAESRTALPALIARVRELEGDFESLCIAVARWDAATEHTCNVCTNGGCYACQMMVGLLEVSGVV